MRALVTGGTGFVGRALVEKLNEPVVLTRNVKRASRRFSERVRLHAWDPDEELIPKSAFEGIDTVFHLAGENVAEGRWTESKKNRIYNSRVSGTRVLVRSLENLDSRPKVLVTASAIGWYGDRGDEALDEDSPPGSGFLAEVCKDWENEATVAQTLGVRVVCLRTGLVLGKNGGALGKMLLPFKAGLGGRLGSGKQWMSWIHLEDLVRLYVFAAQSEGVAGILNATAPEPVTNRDFTKTLGHVLKRPTLFPVPAFALKLALGDFASVLMASQKVYPKATQAAGYEFLYPGLDQALRELVG